MHDDPDDALDALCEAHGVATSYVDFWEHERVPPATTKRALLAAMGVSATVTENAAKSAARPSPETLIVRHGESLPAFDLASRVRAQRMAWDLAGESGGRYSGTCTVAPPGRAIAGTNPAYLRVTCSEWPDDVPIGYHRLAIIDTAHGGTAIADCAVIVCPPRCAAIGDVGGASREFGPAVQLYALRSRRNWGIGDFTDLAALVRMAAWHGAGFVGVNPLHELFLDRAAEASPYSPSSRLALNPLYLDVEAIEDFARCRAARACVAAPAFQARLAALRELALVDYAGVSAAKREVLTLLFDDFRRQHLAPLSDRGRAFRDFAEAPHVHDAALFDAIQAHFARTQAGVWGWPAWPEQYRDRASAAVREFARVHADDVDFYLYLQWQADLQLAHVAEVARDARMPIGLYRDLAVGANAGGAETWQDPSQFALAVHIGAPPDAFNQNGQDWGLPPWLPHALPANGYASWVALLRANMRHAGGLRIDHVMGLLRLFWIPGGVAPPEGTYVDYPIDELLAVLALESVRNGCIVVGEDLGTVPDTVRGSLKRAGVYSYRVLYFERELDGSFLSPPSYPRQALVTISTHDLPTLDGFWGNADLKARDALGLFPSAEWRARQFADRAADRSRLLEALTREGLLPAHGSAESLSFEHVLAVHGYVARTPCALLTVQLEDVFGEPEQVNLPATIEDQYPNWRRKVRVDLEDWERDGRFAAMCAAIRAEGRGAVPDGSGGPRP